MKCSMSQWVMEMIFWRFYIKAGSTDFSYPGILDLIRYFTDMTTNACRNGHLNQARINPKIMLSLILTLALLLK